MTGAGLPHSETPGSKRACRSPGLIAADRVLHRLVMPRHPSCARIRLAEDRNPRHSRYVATLLDTQTVQLSKIGPPPWGREIPSGRALPRVLCRELVGVPGIEPGTSSLSGTRSNQLSYTPGCVGGGNGIRTRDFQLAKLALYQLSYAPVVFRPRDPQAQFASDAFTFSNIHVSPAFEAEVVR